MVSETGNFWVKNAVLQKNPPYSLITEPIRDDPPQTWRTKISHGTFVKRKFSMTQKSKTKEGLPAFSLLSILQHSRLNFSCRLADQVISTDQQTRSVYRTVWLGPAMIPTLPGPTFPRHPSLSPWELCQTSSATQLIPYSSRPWLPKCGNTSRWKRCPVSLIK